jgi:hypothetical protein
LPLFLFPSSLSSSPSCSLFFLHLVLPFPLLPFKPLPSHDSPLQLSPQFTPVTILRNALINSPSSYMQPFLFLTMPKAM